MKPLFFSFSFFYPSYIQLTPQKLSAGQKNHPGAPGAGVWPEDLFFFFFFTIEAPLSRCTPNNGKKSMPLVVDCVCRVCRVCVFVCGCFVVVRVCDRGFREQPHIHTRPPSHHILEIPLLVLSSCVCVCRRVVCCCSCCVFVCVTCFSSYTVRETASPRVCCFSAG